MIKNIYKLFLATFIIVIFFLIYLSFFGVSTNIFNSSISQQIKKIDKNLEVDLDKIFIILKPLEFKIKLKTVGTNIRYNKEEIQFESLRSDISIKSIINKQLSISKINISTKSLEINNLIKFLKLVSKEPSFYVAEQLIKKGYLIADIEVEFDENGNIKKDYVINGFLRDTKINFFNKYNLNKINFIFEAKNNEIQLKDLKLNISDINLNFPEVLILKKNKNYFVSGKLVNKITKITEDKLFTLVNKENLNFNFEEIDFSSENNFKFIFSKNFKINNFEVKSKVDLLNLKLKNEIDIKEYFPNKRENLYLKNNKIEISYKEDDLKISGSGDILIQNKNDQIKYKIQKKKNYFNFDTKLVIKENDFKLDILNFKKIKNSNLEIAITGEKKVKELLIKKIHLTENDNIISIDNLSISNKNKINYVKKINFRYDDKDELKNDFIILNKGESYLINGRSLNIDKLINNLLELKNKKNKKLFQNDFEIILNLNKVNLDKQNIIQNLNGNIYVKNNQIFKANLSSNFLDKKKINFTINTDGNEKITTLFSSNAKPLVDRYKFIKGFEEGSLDFNSIKKNNNSISTLKIYEFKLKELPALTKLLTLASLQGIADLLSGEGIRFNEFEMNFSNQDNLMTIDEIYAIGPAISILMNGYVEKNKMISLRGTLVPATTLNKTIGSIPFLGNILVGNKTGEGVFGVSFKIKGPQNNLETSVNPIKTLTPRFITRTLEKIKKN